MNRQLSTRLIMTVLVLVVSLSIPVTAQAQRGGVTPTRSIFVGHMASGFTMPPRSAFGMPARSEIAMPARSAFTLPSSAVNTSVPFLPRTTSLFPRTSVTYPTSSSALFRTTGPYGITSASITHPTSSTTRITTTNPFGTISTSTYSTLQLEQQAAANRAYDFDLRAYRATLLGNYAAIAAANSPYNTGYLGSYYQPYMYYPSYAPTSTGSGYDSLSTPRDSDNTKPASPATVDVRLPAADADLWFEGHRMEVAGLVRTFTTPPLTPGIPYEYRVRARWTEGNRPVEQSRTIDVQSGQQVTIDFTQPERARLPQPERK